MEFRDPGAMLSATHELDDGSRVRLRLARPSDLPRIEVFVPSEIHSRRFAFYDPRERLALAATRPGEGGEKIIGVARIALDDEAPDVAVDPAAEAAGLGDLLEQAALALARQRRRRAA